MSYEVVPLKPEHTERLLRESTLSDDQVLIQAERAWFSYGSAALCLLSEGLPVFAGGIVNLQWNRGEAWILPNQFFREHVFICLKSLREHLPQLARQCGFRRVQATCVEGISGKLIRHLGFTYEGTMQKFGPNGETCRMYARIMEP